MTEGEEGRKKSRAELRKEAKEAKKKDKGAKVQPSGGRNVWRNFLRVQNFLGEEMEEMVQKEGKEGYLDEYYQVSAGLYACETAMTCGSCSAMTCGSCS
eukprot:1393409-Rhodomonas_salina.1